jgi:hypothetical protein
MVRFSLNKENETSNINNWYNTKEGIEKNLHSLKGLIELFAARHEAGYVRGEQLKEFVILGGNYNLDTCGNNMRANRDIRKMLPEDFPPVLERKEFWELAKKENPAFENMGISYNYQSSVIPKLDLICPFCSQGWTIENVFDTLQLGGTSAQEEIALDGFVGRTLGEVKALHLKRIDAYVLMNQPEHVIQNEKYIDKTPRPDEEKWNAEHPEYPRLVNEHGWLRQEDIDDNYVIGPGDKGWFNVWTFYHRACHRKLRNGKAREQFERIFKNAGYPGIILLETNNRYEGCQDPDCTVCACWFYAYAEVIPLLIGWRKRVIEIDWSAWETDLSALFKKEDVTKGPHHIHAWSEEKAIEYLIRIRTYLEKNPRIRTKILNKRINDYYDKGGTGAF